MSASSSSSSSSPPIARRRKIVIDTDGGCDDAVAILYALRDPTVDVIGITTSYGNVPQEQATENIYTLLRVFSRLDIPFYAGARQPLVVDLDIVTWIGMGVNGLGDAVFAGQGGVTHTKDEYALEVSRALSPINAIQALNDLSIAHPGEIDLIALGPLTNLALGVRMYAGFASRFRSLTIMGGSVYGRGNESLAAEFNFHCDPDGAHVVVRHFPAAGVATTIAPWELTEMCALTWSQFDELTDGHDGHDETGAADGEAQMLEAWFLKRTFAKYESACRYGGKSDEEIAALKVAATLAATTESSSIDASSSSASPSSPHACLPFHPSGPQKFIVCDSYAVAVSLHPELITSSVHHYVDVITQGGSETRGMLAIDWYNRKDGPKVTIATTICVKQFYTKMEEIFQTKINNFKRRKTSHNESCE